MKKSKKGQIGLLMIAFIGFIVGIALFTTVSQTIGQATDTVAVVNKSLTSVVNGTAQYFTDYRSISSVVILNATNDSGGSLALPSIDSNNYTIENNVVYNGQEAVKITPTASAAYKSAWKVSGTAEPFLSHLTLHFLMLEIMQLLQ